MPSAPAENNERFREADLRQAEAAKASPPESVEKLQTVLASKQERMKTVQIPDEPKQQEQLAVLKRSVDARLELIQSMA